MPTSSTVTALRIPPALWKAQGKLRSPAPRADFSIMKMAPMEPSRGSAVISSGGLAEAEASRLMLSLANSSMLQPAEHTDAAAVLRGQGEEGGGGWTPMEGCCCLQVVLGKNHRRPLCCVWCGGMQPHTEKRFLSVLNNFKLCVPT